ncbi:MAG TPA: aminotransferase class V-fold PLP-dependent enzyme [Oligoflexia bacterium]|nr:aminotransferase class V-fold PLP-dependent enzyme [Oligoflexia bacterium]HMR25063.1 aminotransferase class V-fold PLP-dependent enzyme [Oligoflexia bacterium]
MLKTNRKTFIQSLLALFGLSILDIKKLLPSVYAQTADDLENFVGSDSVLENIKHLFPHTSNQRIRYFNTGTLGPSSNAVIEHLCKEIHLTNGAVVDNKQYLPNDGSQQWNKHIETLAQFIHCSADELVLTRNTTEGVNIICHGLPKRHDPYVLITSTKEHIGNIAAWVNRSQNQKDIDIVTFSCNKLSQDECYTLILERISSFPDKAIILSIPHIASDGYLFPVERIGAKIAELNAQRENKIFYFVDGAQSLGMLDVNVKQYQCHAYAASGHKWLCGPKGTGLLYIHSSAQKFIQPEFVGAYACDASFEPLRIDFANNAYRYTYGTQSMQLFSGLAKSADLFQSLGKKTIQDKVFSLAQYFRRGLQHYNQSQSRFYIHDVVNADSTSYSGMVSFAIEDKLNRTYLDSKDLAYERISKLKLNDQRIYLRLRHIYEDNLDAIRASFHIFHDTDDVDLLLLSIQKYLASL